MSEKRLLDQVNKLFVEEDRIHLGSRINRVVKDVYPQHHCAVYFGDLAHNELILQTAQNAEQRFPATQGIAAELLKSRDLFVLSDYDEFPLVKAVDCPGLTHPKEIFAAIGEFDSSTQVMVAIYSETSDLNDVDSLDLEDFARMAAIAWGKLIQLTETQEFNTSLFDAIANTIDCRSSITLGQARRIIHYCENMLHHMGVIGEDRQATLMAARLIHAGRIFLSDITIDQIQYGRRLQCFTDAFIRQIQFPDRYKKVPQILNAILEDFDGNGVPHGLMSEEIPVGARILRVAIVFDYLYPISKSPQSEVIRGLRNSVGVQYDPDVVDVFLKHECYKLQPRQFDRYELSTPLLIEHVTDEDGTHETFETSAIDISQNGVKILHTHELPIGALVNVTLFLPCQETHAIGMVTRVVDKTKTEWEIGIYFLWIGSER